ncbi:hypothetical protein BX600DRAFT_477124 [Xylariales sp. PMI_506]|nr:hypothetical protein BX600DRAFT_477124 [Xylariales sp. PMI_506]
MAHEMRVSYNLGGEVVVIFILRSQPLMVTQLALSHFLLFLCSLVRLSYKMRFAQCLSTLFFISLAKFSNGQAIAAWHNSVGTQILIQNSTTGDVYYSNCNSSGTPVFPTDPLHVLSFTRRPKLGSAFAGTGYASDNTIYASIWYTDDNDNIWQLLAQCNSSESKLTVTGTYLASANITTAISSSTGLAGFLLSAGSGYRVFFHNSTGYVHELVYTTKTGWSNGALAISPDVPAGNSLSATFYGTSNLTIAYPLDGNTIELSEYNSDKTFHDSTFPYPLTDDEASSASTTAFSVNTSASVDALPNWSTDATVGVTVDEDGSARHIFYIDTEKQLQYYGCDLAAAVSCTLADRQNSTYWGAADDAAGKLGVAWADRQSDVVYFSNNTLVLVQMESGEWSEMQTLTGDIRTWSTTTVPSSDSNSTGSAGDVSPTTSSSSNGGSSSGLSTGAAAGIGVGMTIVALGAIGAAVFLALRKRKRIAAEAAARAQADELGLPPCASIPGSGHKYEMDSTPSSKRPPMFNGEVFEVSGQREMQELHSNNLLVAEDPGVRYELAP